MGVQFPFQALCEPAHIAEEAPSDFTSESIWRDNGIYADLHCGNGPIGIHRRRDCNYQLVVVVMVRNTTRSTRFKLIFNLFL